jgi:pSer/pThr/pTyr-binding forkhead associated (FHA) protein
MRAQLIPLDGGEPVEIVKDMTLVGRREDCDLRIDHKSVSKMHCLIVKTDGLLLLRDLGSTNGTRVNGQRVRRAALLPNDQLSIAGFDFRVYLGPGEAPVPGDDRTQHLDAEEVARLLKKAQSPSSRRPDEDDDDDLADRPERRPTVPVQPNALPDVYPEDSRPRGG